ncbi:hypothetical protein D5F01_LYC24013 [Larimichthys crocea]|uniref:Uncharacterized protein n=1 Tax=Larimichthys crocea TaxID=215358 RepID=A0A6G0HG36_LARCR|nr:hypothetical protein D5F01_LYC24013 [Larimichthys crocea]
MRVGETRTAKRVESLCTGHPVLVQPGLSVCCSNLDPSGGLWLGQTTSMGDKMADKGWCVSLSPRGGIQKSTDVVLVVDFSLMDGYDYSSSASTFSPVGRLNFQILDNSTFHIVDNSNLEVQNLEGFHILTYHRQAVPGSPPGFLNPPPTLPVAHSLIQPPLGFLQPQPSALTIVLVAPWKRSSLVSEQPKESEPEPGNLEL